MRIIKKHVYLTMSLIVLVGFLFPSSIAAKSEKLNHYTHTWEEDTLINSSEQVEQNFYITEDMEVSKFTMNLKIKKSPTLIEDISSLTIILNGTPVHSINIDSLDDKGSLNIKIPPNLINKGRNSLVIDVFLKSTTDRCELNPDINWLILEKNSSFEFKTTKQDSQSISNIFENTYYADGLRSIVQLAVPEELTQDNYSQISSVSALLGYIHKDKEIDLLIEPIKHTSLYESEMESIVIGTPEQIQQLDKELLTDQEWQKAKENGFIGLRKIGEQSHFLLIVSDQSQLETLIGILQNKATLSQIQDASYVLDETKLVNKPNFITKSTFKNLGYETFSQSGNGSKEFSYYLTIPTNQRLTSENKFSFTYNYSSLLKNDDAYVTVEINDNKLLTKEILKDSDTGKIEFSIPDKYYDLNGYKISLKFNLAPEEDNCLVSNNEGLWVEVDAEDSYFDLELEDRQGYSLLNAGGLFQDSEGMIDGTIHIDDYNNLSLYSLCNLSSYLGQMSQGVNKLILNSGDKATDSVRAIIGLSSSALIQSVADNIQIPVSESDEFIKEDLFIQNTDTLGVIAVGLDNNQLIITASDDKQLNLAIQEYKNIISPNTSVILKDRQIIDQFAEKEDIDNIDADNERMDPVILIAAAVLLIFTTISFLLYFKKIKE